MANFHLASKSWNRVPYSSDIAGILKDLWGKAFWGKFWELELGRETRQRLMAVKNQLGISLIYFKQLLRDDHADLHS